MSTEYLDQQKINNTHKSVITIIKQGKSTDFHYLIYNDIQGIKKRVLHRDDGPAIESKSEKRYFINGEEIFQKK